MACAPAAFVSRHVVQVHTSEPDAGLSGQLEHALTAVDSTNESGAPAYEEITIILVAASWL